MVRPSLSPRPGEIYGIHVAFGRHTPDVPRAFTARESAGQCTYLDASLIRDRLKDRFHFSLLSRQVPVARAGRREADLPRADTHVLPDSLDRTFGAIQFNMGLTDDFCSGPRPRGKHLSQPRRPPPVGCDSCRRGRRTGQVNTRRPLQRFAPANARGFDPDVPWKH